MLTDTGVTVECLTPKPSGLLMQASRMVIQAPPSASSIPFGPSFSPTPSSSETQHFTWDLTGLPTSLHPLVPRLSLYNMISSAATPRTSKDQSKEQWFRLEPCSTAVGNHFLRAGRLPLASWRARASLDSFPLAAQHKGSVTAPAIKL